MFTFQSFPSVWRLLGSWAEETAKKQQGVFKVSVLSYQSPAPPTEPLILSNTNRPKWFTQ